MTNTHPVTLSGDNYCHIKSMQAFICIFWMRWMYSTRLRTTRMLLIQFRAITFLWYIVPRGIQCEGEVTDNFPQFKDKCQGEKNQKILLSWQVLNENNWKWSQTFLSNINPLLSGVSGGRFWEVCLWCDKLVFLGTSGWDYTGPCGLSF